MTAGSDVAELDANLRVLGYGDPSGDAFTSESEAAISRLQTAHGLPVTGQAATRLRRVRARGGPRHRRDPDRRRERPTGSRAHGDVAPPGRHDRTRRSSAGERARRRPGRDHAPRQLGHARPRLLRGHGGECAPSGAGSSGAGSPTIELQVAPTVPRATGRLDQAPVDVSITTASVHHVLDVPVNALLALTGGGYAVEEFGAGGLHRLVAVSLGLF